METDRVVQAMARWWQTVSNEDDDPNARNPMLYDPLQEGNIRTSKKMQYVAAIVVCLGAVSAGTALAWTSPVLPKILINETEINTINLTNSTSFTNLTDLKISRNSTNEFRITENQGSWVGSFLAVGAFFGAVPSGFIADKIGRKYTAMLMAIPFILSWITTVFANSAGLLYLARFLIGLSTGGFCVIAPMYINEIAETSIRGTLGTFFQLFLTIGILFVNAVGAAVDWVTLSLICMLLPITLLIGMIFMPETPTYLLKKGRRGDAALSLKWLWGKYCDSRSAIQVIQNDLDSTSGTASVLDLFRNSGNLKGLFISLALMFFQQLSGINAVIFYTVEIFNSAGSTMNANTSTIIVSVVQVIMTFGSALLIERAGRKILLLFSSAVMGICLAILGAYFNLQIHGHDLSHIGWLPLLCVVLFIITFSIGFGPIPWIMMGELFLPDVKGAAVSLTVMFNWVAVFGVTKGFDFIKNSWGLDFTFWFFSGFMILGTIFVATIVFETKGKSAAQIQMQLSGEKPGQMFSNH